MHFNKPQYSFFDASAFDRSIPPGTITPLPFTIPFTGSASITASQVLFDGSLLVALQARNSIMEFAEKNEKITQENIRYNVLKSYNSLVIAYKQFHLIKGLLTLTRSMAADLDKTRAAGFAEKIDVERTSVQINNLATDSLKISNLLSMSEQMLKFSIGMDINTPIVLIDTNVEKISSESLQLIAVKENYERVPEYAALMAGLKLSEYDLKRYKLAALPTLSGFWQGGYNYGASKFADMAKFDEYRSYSSLGLSLTVPIFNGLLRVNQVREAKLNIEKFTNNIEFMKQTIDFQGASARTNLRNSLLQVQSQKRNLELSNSILDLAQKKYKAGVGSNFEVTTAQSDLLSSQNNYFEALLAVINAEADLKKALGLLK
jgi:outer membrane protein TolC